MRQRDDRLEKINEIMAKVKLEKMSILEQQVKRRFFFLFNFETI
jgi:hypothetical protein